MVHPASQNGGWLRKVLARFECDGVPAFDLYFFAGLWVPSHPRLPIHVFERTEPDQRHFAVLFFEPGLDAVKCGIKCDS